MKCNVGLVDRVLRITFGLAIAVLGIVFNSWWGLIGIIPLATGIFKIFPLYIPFKLSTTKKEK